MSWIQKSVRRSALRKTCEVALIRLGVGMLVAFLMRGYALAQTILLKINYAENGARTQGGRTDD